jgi:hypothetical protein
VLLSQGSSAAPELEGRRWAWKEPNQHSSAGRKALLAFGPSDQASRAGQNSPTRWSVGWVSLAPGCFLAILGKEDATNLRARLSVRSRWYLLHFVSSMRA